MSSGIQTLSTHTCQATFAPTAQARLPLIPRKRQSAQTYGAPTERTATNTLQFWLTDYFVNFRREVVYNSHCMCFKIYFRYASPFTLNTREKASRTEVWGTHLKVIPPILCHLLVDWFESSINPSYRRLFLCTRFCELVMPLLPGHRSPHDTLKFTRHKLWFDMRSQNLLFIGNNANHIYAICAAPNSSLR